MNAPFLSAPLIRSLCALGASLCLAGVLHAGDFETGNAAYEAGKFSEAAAAYESAAKAGAIGANLSFNLGNAYFRAGNPGRAVLHYERALALEPGHPEAAANLGHALRATRAPREAVPGWLVPATRLGGDRLTLLACAGAWIAFAGAVLAFGPVRRRTAGFSLLGAGALGAILALTMFVLLDGGAKNSARAIIVAKEGAKALYAPAETSRTAATLPAGAEVRVLQDRISWQYVEIPGGIRGWVPATALERVIPRGR